jgi:hypothetical protein
MKQKKKKRILLQLFHLQQSNWTSPHQLKIDLLFIKMDQSKYHQGHFFSTLKPKGKKKKFCS